MYVTACSEQSRGEILVLNSSLCRPHPVKPLTSSQPEKKEGRSVLEKLKSTINPGRAANQAAAEAEKNQVLIYIMIDCVQIVKDICVGKP